MVSKLKQTADELDKLIVGVLKKMNTSDYMINQMYERMKKKFGIGIFIKEYDLYRCRSFMYDRAWR